MESEASRENRAFYGEVPAGQRDYWQKMAAPRHRVSTLLREIARDDPASLVDLGCGGGELLDEIHTVLPHAELAGVDLSERLIELNRANHPGVQWYVDDLDRRFAGLGRTFDAVVAMEVIEHLDRPLDFLCSARDLATPGGRLYLSTQSGPMRETERRVGHRRHYSAANMDQALRGAGWVPLRVWNTGFPFHDLSKWYANLSPDRSMAAFGEKPYGFRQNAICWALRLAFRLNSRRRGAQLFAVARNGRAPSLA